MNLKFAKSGKTMIYKIIKMTIMSQKELILMVGVPDYQTYVEHMRKHHPDLEAMDPKTFYRHCVDSRYPSAGGGMKKCPC